MSDIQTTGRMPGEPPSDDDESRVRSAAHGVAEQASALKDTGREEAAHVVDEVRAQSTRLVGDARSTARERADAQVGHLATALHDMSGELERMGQSAKPDGALAAVVADGATAMRQWSQRIEAGGLDGTLRDVRAFARQRPFAFLGGAFAVGLLAGRLMRNADLGAIGHDARQPVERPDRDLASAQAMP